MSLLSNLQPIYGNNGTLLKEYAEKPFLLLRMASVSFNIGREDIRGGIGANFIIEWGANNM